MSSTSVDPHRAPGAILLGILDGQDDDARLMNHRVVVIVLLSLWTTCFVGTGAIATLSVVKGIVNSTKSDRNDPYARTAPKPYEPQSS